MVSPDKYRMKRRKENAKTLSLELMVTFQSHQL